MNRPWILALLALGLASSLQASVVKDFDLLDTNHSATITPAMQAKVRDLAIQHADALFHDEKDVSLGNPKGNLILVEFMDYQCPISASTSPLIISLIQKNPNLHVIFKQLPLRGKISNYASRAALLANQNGDFKDLNIHLMENSHNLSIKLIDQLALKAGLSSTDLDKGMKDPQYIQTIKNTLKLGSELKLMGTPSFFIARSDVNSQSKSDSILYMMGKFNQDELQAGLNYIKH